MFEEYEDRQTNESKLTKQLDVFDAVLQAVSVFLEIRKKFLYPIGIHFVLL